MEKIITLLLINANLKYILLIIKTSFVKPLTPFDFTCIEKFANS